MWSIVCTDSNCKATTTATDIVDLRNNHRDEEGWFVCRRCGERGCIEKSFSLQEPGQVWSPFLKGLISLGDPGGTYQPFVLLVGDSPNGPADQVWFSYYKDLRPEGRLKLGYGPGGSPVLAIGTVVHLLDELTKLGYVDGS
jgi:hypothetical protein